MKYLSPILAILVACLMAGSALAVQHEGGQQDQGQQQGQQPQTEYTLLAHSAENGFFTLEDGQQDQQQQDQQDQQQQDQQQQDQQQQEQQVPEEDRNPVLMVPPGEQITITLRAADSEGEHNFCVDLSQQGQQQQDQQQQDQQQQDQQQQDQQQQAQCSEMVSQQGDEVEFNFTVPESGQTGQTGNDTGGQQNQTYTYFSESNPQTMRGQIVVQEDTGDGPFQPEDPEQQPDGEEEPTPGPALIGILAALGFAGLFAARRRRE